VELLPPAAAAPAPAPEGVEAVLALVPAALPLVGEDLFAEVELPALLVVAEHLVGLGYQGEFLFGFLFFLLASVLILKVVFQRSSIKCK
jgi:hypothetical protein